MLAKASEETIASTAAMPHLNTVCMHTHTQHTQNGATDAGQGITEETIASTAAMPPPAVLFKRCRQIGTVMLRLLRKGRSLKVCVMCLFECVCLNVCVCVCECGQKRCHCSSCVVQTLQTDQHCDCTRLLHNMIEWTNEYTGPRGCVDEGACTAEEWRWQEGHKGCQGEGGGKAVCAVRGS